MVKVKTAFGWCVCKYDDNVSSGNSEENLPRKNEDARESTDSPASSSVTSDVNRTAGEVVSPTT